MPLFLGQTIVLFEGNVSLLNVYAEHREPRKMLPQVILVHFYVIFAVLTIGLLSYYAFGEDLETIILFNLPSGSSFTILTQVMYMFNIMGCFVV